MKKFIRLLLQGILLVAPIALTLYILLKIFRFFDSLLEDYLGSTVPGLGIVVLVVFLVFMGYLGNTFIAIPIKKSFRKALNKVPLVSLLYDSLKDLLGAFVGKKKKFNKPVMVKAHKDATTYKVGFVTAESLDSLGVKNGLSTVYFPHSYAFSGVVLLVENEYLSVMDAPAAEVMKFVVSGGVIQAKK